MPHLFHFVIQMEVASWVYFPIQNREKIRSSRSFV